MLFNYKAITSTGENKVGTIDASSKDLAIVALQRRGFFISSIDEEKAKKGMFNISFFGQSKIKMKDIVIMSRQMSTLFESQVSALKAFTLLAENSENQALVAVLNEVAEDIRSGVSISGALAKHKVVFSDFYVNMIRAGEETGKLTQTFSYLADYLDRQYQLTSKTKNALIYPAFVVGVFILVMCMMFVFIIPKLALIIRESSAEIPFFTRLIMSLSDLFVRYGVFILIAVVIFVVYIIHYSKSPAGRLYFDRLKINTPVFKSIYTKLYLSRISDNMDTMLSSGIPIVRSIELTSAVVGNRVFEGILKDVSEAVKGGSSLSDAFSKHKEVPPIMPGMIRVGEETGSLGNILKTLGRFYAREVNEAVDTLVGLIEPVMIVILGLGVGILLSSILMPIYNIAGGV
ncbi:MAG: type II secretion system F family protein [Candidatus Paceibacterota bacterium]|jgi:type IV pilus assembly protein PilC